MQNRNLLNYSPLFAVAVVLILLVAVYSYTSESSDSASSDKVQVTASFYPMYFFASEIGGDKATVRNITPSGAEPHDYEPSAQEIAKIQNSDILIVNGSVEPWADNLKSELEESGVDIITAGDGLLTKEIEEDGEVMRDPHAWLSPVLAKKEASRILEGYKRVDSENSAYYEDNAQRLMKRLDALDVDFETGLNICKRDDIITAHSAFAYLADEYELNQVAIVGISADEEPSSQKLAEVTNFVRANNIKYIFFETLLNPEYSETIANETGAQTLVLDPLEGISDEKSAQGDDYFSVMQDNLKNLRTALECEQ